MPHGTGQLFGPIHTGQYQSDIVGTGIDGTDVASHRYEQNSKWAEASGVKAFLVRVKVLAVASAASYENASGFHMVQNRTLDGPV